MSSVNSFRNEPWMVVDDNAAWPTSPSFSQISPEDTLLGQPRKLDQFSTLSPSAEPFEPRQVTPTKKQSKKKAPIPVNPPDPTPPPAPTPTETEIQAALSPSIEDELSKQSLYKTELCRSFCETGICRYGHKCQFAHGQPELRILLRHPKYKTEKCKTFVTSGNCPYGPRCRFIHPPSTVPTPPSTVPTITEQPTVLSKPTIEWSASWNEPSTPSFTSSWNAPSTTPKKSTKKTNIPTVTSLESELDEKNKRLSIFKALTS